VAAVWAAAVWYYGLGLTALTAAVFGTILLGIAVTDARHYLIPDEYTIVGLPLGLLLAVAGGWPGLLEAAVGAAFGFVLLYAVAWAGERVFRKEAMGGGDIKMMAMVGAYVGWKGVLLTIFGGALLGTLIFVPLTLRKKQLVPFGVFLAAAAALTFVFGDAVLAWYLDFALGPS
jgi:leader peptidase (prepilin peptidase)/N-methyltransferase